MKYRIGTETLTFNGKTYKAVSGPHGDGALPTGGYNIKIRHAVEGSGLASGFCTDGVCFFIPLEPLFDAEGRDGFGIHPDGNVSGTKGCIGLTATDAPKFLKAWKALGINSRPKKLQVLD